MLDRLVKSLNGNGFPVVLENRDSSLSWVYDGRSIALFCTKGRYKEHDILHEIGHFIAATPDQWLFPEYALRIGLVDPYALGTVKDGLRDPNRILSYKYFFQVKDGLVQDREQDIQELLAQKISIFFGRILNISPNFLSEDFSDWDFYEKLKDEKNQDYLRKEVSDRFDELLPNLHKIATEARR